MNDDYLKQQLGSWKVNPPAENLADRLWRNAVALPQQRPWHWHLERAIERSLTEWHYGLSYKLTGIACFALIGFFSASQEQPLTIATNTVALTDIAMARGDWLEQL